MFAAESEFDPATCTREFTLLMADYVIAVVGGRLSQLLEREAPSMRLHVRLVRESLAMEAGEAIRRVDAIVAPPLTSLMAPHLRSVELFRDRWVCIAWRGNTRVSERFDLRVRECPGAPQTIVEALWWCDDHDDDPAHGWLRTALARVAADL